MKMLNVVKNVRTMGSVCKCLFACLVFMATLIWGSPVLGLGAPLKFSPSHWLKSIPGPPETVSRAKLVCPEVGAIPERIIAARSEAEKLAGDELDLGQLVQELMIRGNIALIQEMARMEQQRVKSQPAPLKLLQADKELTDAGWDLHSAQRRVGEGLTECFYLDPHLLTVDQACIEKNNQTIRERTRDNYNNYLRAVLTPLLAHRKYTEWEIASEESISRVESGTDSTKVHKYMLQWRIALLDVVYRYARTRSDACRYPDSQE